MILYSLVTPTNVIETSKHKEKNNSIKKEKKDIKTKNYKKKKELKQHEFVYGYDTYRVMSSNVFFKMYCFQGNSYRGE